MEIYRYIKKIVSEINLEIASAGFASLEEPPKPRCQLIPEKISKECPKYVQKIIREINSTYENGCFNACSVLIRRVLESMMIEAFENRGLRNLIQKNNEYKSAEEIKNELLRDPFNNLSRSARRALNNKKILWLGNLSAHDRFFTAQKSDVDNISSDIRILIEYLIHQMK